MRLPVAIVVLIVAAAALAPFLAAGGETCALPPRWGGRFAADPITFDSASLQDVLDAATAAPLRLAFVGDMRFTAFGGDMDRVLELIRDEGADALVHGGDFDYLSLDTKDHTLDGMPAPAAWDRAITAVLGPDFPIFAALGNHDIDTPTDMRGYQALLRARLGRAATAMPAGALVCAGEVGVSQACSFRGSLVLSLSVALLGSPGDFETYIDCVLSNAAVERLHPWRICSWHAVAEELQTGLVPRGRNDDPKLGPYEACRRGGAFVANAHDHAYVRTRSLSSFDPPTLATTAGDRDVEVGAGRSFSFVSGLGGYNARPPMGGRDRRPWFATTYNFMQGARAAVLFCDLGSTSDASPCQLKTIDGKVVDAFEIVNHNQAAESDPHPRNAADGEPRLPGRVREKTPDKAARERGDEEGATFRFTLGSLSAVVAVAAAAYQAWRFAVGQGGRGARGRADSSDGGDPRWDKDPKLRA